MGIGNDLDSYEKKLKLDSFTIFFSFLHETSIVAIFIRRAHEYSARRQNQREPDNHCTVKSPLLSYL
jgi:hypothetical protein